MNLLRLVRSLLVALALAAVAAVVSLLPASDHLRAGAGLRLDPLRAPLLLLVTVLGATIAVYSVRNLQGQARLRRFAALLLVAVLGLTCSVLAGSAVTLAIGWVVASLAVSGLVAHAGTAAARSAGRYVRRWLLLSDALLVAGLALAVLTSRTTQLSGLATVPAGASTLPLVAAAALIGAAGVVRSALVPAARWLPETAEAPSPVSALLHAGLVNAVGVVSLLVWPLMAQVAVVRVALLVVGATTAVVATAAMRTRPDVKGRLAASTSSQMGYLAVEVGLGLPVAVLAHVVGHGLWKAGLFLGAGGAIDKVRAGGGTAADRAVSGTAAQSSAAASAGRRNRGRHHGGSRGRTALLAALTGLVVLVVAVLPLPLPRLLDSTAELAPLVLATAAATVAVRHGSRLLPALLAAVAYVLGLRVLAALLGPAGDPATLGWAGDLALVVLLVAAGLALALVDSRARRGQAPDLTARTAWLSLIPRAVAAGGTLRAGRRLRRVLRAAASQQLPVARQVVVPTRLSEVRAQVDIAATVVGPVWPLAAFVASNPLAGLERLPFADALDIATRTWNAQPLRDLDPSGAASDARLREAWSRHLATFVTARALATSEWGCPTSPHPWATARAEAHHLARALQHPEAAAWLLRLPADPTAALAVLLASRPGWGALDLAALLARDPGWAAHVAWRRREGRDGGDQAALLALRLALDVLLGVEAAAPIEVADHHGGAALAARSDAAGDATHGAAAATALPAVDLTSLESAEEEWRAPVLTALAQRAANAGAGVSLGLAPRAAAPARTTAASDLAGREPEGSDADTDGPRADGPGTDGGQPTAAPFGQLVACIDVRSERLRRHLEAAGPWETFGAAGFFGVTLEHRSASGAVSARCPALVRPAFGATVPPAAAAPTGRSGLGAVSAAPVVPFALAEASGWVTAAGTVLRTALPGLSVPRAGQIEHGEDAAPEATPLAPAALDGSALPSEVRVEVAAGFLASIGLRDLATVVVLCGHTGHVANNPHVAAYDCGACGGWSGDDNARAMATLLNDPAVREALRDRGFTFAPGCQVLPAVHDTTADEVSVLDSARTPEARTALSRLLPDLARACEGVRAERRALLPDATGRSALAARGVDWAQPRPEWGLAGNAAFVIGPRRLTRGLDLHGRVFLHSYEPGQDTEGAVLRSLMSAPMVVGQWISMQYWASSVAPELWGAGDKTTHNAIAPAVAGVDPTAAVTGVLTGAHGDLRIGLPWQAVLPEAPGVSGDGSWLQRRSAGHEPLRLLVVVTATPEAVDAVLADEPSVARLVTGGWVSLAVLHPDTGQLSRWSDGEWLAVRTRSGAPGSDSDSDFGTGAYSNARQE